MKPIVAIVGVPNSGKSTLYNRLLGKKIAVTSNIPGTTRDRLFGDITWRGVDFILIDTGGLDINTKDIIGKNIQNQILLSLKIADLILFLVDSRKEITALDKKAMDLIRKSGKKVILVVNKVDSSKLQSEVEKFTSLGFKEQQAISALHGKGTGDLLDKIVQNIQNKKIGKKENDFISVTIIGRPNVGKSSLLNYLLGEQRVLVHSKPGTTRDAIDTEVTYQNKKIKLIDTAGIRRRGKIEKGIEQYSTIRAIWAIGRADIVILLLDGKEGPTKQDAHIAQYAKYAQCGIILTINKWDLVKDKNHNRYIKIMQQKLSFLHWAPIIFISAKTGKNVYRLWDLIFSIDAERKKRVSIKKLNKVVSEAIISHPPPVARKHPAKIYYSTQAQIQPPTFVFFTNNAQAFHFSYRRYLENKIRENFGYQGTVIKIIFKEKELPKN